MAGQSDGVMVIVSQDPIATPNGSGCISNCRQRAIVQVLKAETTNVSFS
jgi:hypothetical protein